MDLQVHSRYNQGSMLPRSTKSKKANQQVVYVQSNFNKNVDTTSKRSNKKYSQVSNSDYTQYKPSYPSWEVFDTNRGKPKGNYQGHGKYGNQYNQSYYAKNSNLDYRSNYNTSSEKASRSTGVSDNDNGFGNLYSDLAGFKIVQNGKTVYDETQEDFDLSDSDGEEALPTKFAASVLTITPNAKDISLPSFA